MVPLYIKLHTHPKGPLTDDHGEAACSSYLCAPIPRNWYVSSVLI